MNTINEVQFVAEIKSWIDHICRSQGPDFPFWKADIEVRVVGKLKRRDIVIYNRQGTKVLTGEFKLPDRADGRSPYDSRLVEDAHHKADAEGIEYFFTSNINRTVLWRTFSPGTPIIQREVEPFEWADISDSSVLLRPEVQDALKAKVREFILTYAEIYTRARDFRRLPLDRKFVSVLDSALDGPRNLSRTLIARRADADRKFRDKVGRWVEANLGTAFRADQREEMCDVAARFSCYILAIKIVFYDALRRKHTGLPTLVTKQKTTATRFGERLMKFFRRAEEVSGDYETVFQGDDFGDGLPLLGDVVVDAWRHLVKQVDDYDFTKIEFDVIGHIFEQLISPAERRRYGQHYTKSEIVDLINAFCIRKSTDVVIDPACGGGTFLVRAYARKRWLEDLEKQKRDHIDRLAEIFGVDISTYPARLSVVSLATRDLSRVANYPRVVCDDFFDVRKGKRMFPAGFERIKGKSRVVPVALDHVDAVVGNPPYVRQESLDAKHKKKYSATAGQNWGELKLSGRSDLHVYFWPHAASFLPDKHGYFGFLTSSSWLDVEYGFSLQRWILKNFCIEAIIESSVEPWFTDARVATVVTILRREPNHKARMNNTVRFVQIRRPLESILEDVQHGDDHIGAAEELRRRILVTKKNTETKDWRIRVVKQNSLIEAEDPSNEGNHTGGKWGIPLRAPDIYFELMDRFGDKFVPLRELAEVRFGVKTGCDAFFFPRDTTEVEMERLGDREFKEQFGISKKQTEKIRVCKSGDGSVHLIEAEYLEPEVHSLMEIDSPIVDSSKLSRKILLVSEPKSKLRGKHVLKYIKYGEKHPMGRGGDGRPVHEKVSVKSRASENRQWYDLMTTFRGDMFWPMAQQYRHVIPINSERLICNHNLFDVKARSSVDPHELAAILNSTLVALAKIQFGRGVGREANLKTEVVDVTMMLVPDVRQMSAAKRKRLQEAFSALSELPTRKLPEEFERAQRRELDASLLIGLGCARRVVEPFLNRLYTEITDQFAAAREMELIAQKNRLKATRKTDTTSKGASRDEWELAEEIVDDLDLEDE